MGRTLGPQAGTAWPARQARSGPTASRPPAAGPRTPPSSPYINRDPPAPTPTLTLTPFPSQPPPHSTPARSLVALARRHSPPLVDPSSPPVRPSSLDLVISPPLHHLSLSSLLPQSLSVFLFTPSPLFADAILLNPALLLCGPRLLRRRAPVAQASPSPFVTLTLAPRSIRFSVF